MTVPMLESAELHFNVDHGYLEGLVRGCKASLLTQQDYISLAQCETLEGRHCSARHAHGTWGGLRSPGQFRCPGPGLQGSMTLDKNKSYTSMSNIFSVKFYISSCYGCRWPIPRAESQCFQMPGGLL